MKVKNIVEQQIDLIVNNYEFHDIVSMIRLILDNTCPYCNEKFSWLSGVITHIKSVHKHESCPVCGFSGKNLTKHYASHSDPRHFVLYILYNGRNRNSEVRKIRGLFFDMMYFRLNASNTVHIQSLSSIE